MGPRVGSLPLEAERLQLSSSETGDLGSRDVRRERGLTEHTDVDDERLDTQLA
jgi:hypothetical protein